MTSTDRSQRSSRLNLEVDIPSTLEKHMTEPRSTHGPGGQEQPPRRPSERVRRLLATAAPTMGRVIAARILSSVIEHWWGS
ncbi:hypothetical protein DMO24_02945 [Modestobacter versicolor]|uniref:Uncharacterized protein n=1 Tax=Modestobacter versicolor TaxID=429133 RepID=A0A323VVL1_9ACTN|nr:hypothetical protein DMO24_02945 [Modestobacter versicolor]